MPEATPQRSAKGDAGESTPAKPKGNQDRAKMFQSRDRDNDGQLTREEFLRGQPDPDEAPKRFPRFDTNGDGVLSREEFIKGGKN